MCKYDVIVVGAGNAGLSCAATTSKAGLKTLLLEKNPVPGGSASSFRRGRFEFDPSLHEISNIGSPEQEGSLRKMLENYGAEIDWCIDTAAFRTMTDTENGYDVTMPSGVDAFCEALESAVPGSKESALEAFAIEEKVQKAIAYLSSGNFSMDVLANEHTDFLRACAYSLDECLDALGMPEKAQSIFKTYWSYLGGNTGEIDMAHYMLMLRSYMKTYPAVPEKRSHELSLAVEKAIKNNGGDVRYHCEVSEVLFEGDRAVGVRVGDDEFYAQHIVLNCHPSMAFGTIIPGDKVPEAAVKLTNARDNGLTFVNVYLGLNRSAEELGIKDYTIFLADNPDTQKQFENLYSLDCGVLIANCLNILVPSASEEGTSIVTLTCAIKEKAWEDVKPQDYKKLKNKLAEKMIDIYERKLGIDIKPYIEEISVAAPPTFARYLNTPSGTPYGYQIQSWDTMMARILNSKNESYIQGLHFAGAFSERCGGYSPTYTVGNSVGRKIIKEVKGNG